MSGIGSQNTSLAETNLKRHEPVFGCIGERNDNVLVDEDEEKQEEAQTHCTQNTRSAQLTQRGYLKHRTFMEVKHRHWKRTNNRVNLRSQPITDPLTQTRPSSIVWLNLQQTLINDFPHWLCLAITIMSLYNTEKGISIGGGGSCSKKGYKPCAICLNNKPVGKHICCSRSKNYTHI